MPPPAGLWRDRPERSVLAVPASNWRMIEKGVASDADVVFLDLEDAVAPGEKISSRANVVRAFRELQWGAKPRLYRVNGLVTPYFYRDLIDVIEPAAGAVDLIMLPKCEGPQDVHVAATLLGQLELNLGLERPIGLEIQIESPAGVLHAAQIAAGSSRIESLVFGPGDYAASVGMPVTAIGGDDEWDAAYPGHRFHDVMHGILVAGRAAGVRVIDGPYATFRDLDGLRQSARRARALGYDGKWCIHPAQIPVVNEVFSPSPDEIAWAEKVVASAATAAEGGQGALQIDGIMVDAASVKMAERTLRKAGRTSQ
jgi:citrate lyase beta subunit